MIALETKTGPGGTEFLTRPASSVTKEPRQRKDSRPALEWRRQFWLDTCREVLEMRNASPKVLELHRLYGCRFCPPTTQQVQYVLDALDVALPRWDREHPELFYQTLELNFPELLRICRAQRRN